MTVERPLLELRSVEVRYGTVAAVRDLSLDVRRGELVGLIGPNGAGKSTTLHAIMGLVPVSSGEILVDGAPVAGRAPEAIARSGVALVPEGRRVFASFSVEDNLRLGLAARPDGDAAEALREVYELFPMLRDFRRRPASIGGLLDGGPPGPVVVTVGHRRRPVAGRVPKPGRHPSGAQC